MSNALFSVMSVESRAPQGARGLKFEALKFRVAGFQVAPRKGRVG